MNEDEEEPTTQEDRPCVATRLAMAMPNHIHTCTGKHDEDEDHYCGVCGRWWWIQGTL